MKHCDMRLENATEIFNLVYSGKSTIKEIEKFSGLSHQAIKNICMNFISCGSFELKSLEASSKGRPEYSFSVSPKIFSAFFYQSLSRSDIIFINAYSDVVGRYEYTFDKNISSKENFQKALSIILDNENYGNCTSVYVTCQDKFKSLVPNSFNFTNSHESQISKKL